MSTRKSALQQLSQRNYVGANRAANTRNAETNERLEEFIGYFVKESEAKFNAYHLILEGDDKRSGKFTKVFSELVGYGVGGTVGIVATYLGFPSCSVKALSSAGKKAGQKISDKFGFEKYAKGVRQLSDLVKLYKNCKAAFRKALVEAGFDIFQSFEMQFMGVSVQEPQSNAMHVLAEDAINRAVNYFKKDKSVSIAEGILLGESKRKDVTSTSPGFSVTYKSQACKITWNTASLYSKVGLLKVEKGMTLFLRKKESKTGKYGYRRLLNGENGDALSEVYMRDNIAESQSGHFTNYDYMLDQKDMEEKCGSILTKIDSGDKDLAENRIKELLVEVKNDILEEINILKEQADEHLEDRKTLINLEERINNFNSDELLKNLKQCLSETKEEIAVLIRQSSENTAQRLEKMSYDNSDQHGKTQAAVETVGEKIEVMKKGQERNEQTLQKIEKVTQELDKNVKKVCENDETVRQQRRRNQVPFWFGMKESIKSFTGRQNHLDQIAEYAKNEMVVIAGLSGVGKTELAIKYAYTHYNSDNYVIWINAKNRKSIKDSFHRLYVKLGFKIIEDGTEKDIKSISEDVYGHFSRQKSLFIFDDVEKYATVKDVLPRGLPTDANKPHVLITCHKLEVERGMTLRLGDFTVDESMDFIKQFFSVKGDSQIAEIRQLAEKVYNFPLALQQAVAHILEEDRRLKNVDPEKEFTINDYLEEFGRKTEELLKCEVFQKLESDYDKTTFTAVQITLSKIKNQKDAERVFEILNIMSYFSSENIPASFFLESSYGDERNLGAIIQVLKDYSVVSGKGHLNMHGLIQQVIRLELTKVMDGGSVAEEIILRKALEMLKKYMTDYPTIQQYIPHITSVWNHASKYTALIDTFLVNCIDDPVPYITYFHVIVESSPFKTVRNILQKIEEHFPKQLSKVINQKYSTGATPLYCAAESGDERKVKFLMDKGADIDVKTKRKSCLLHVAAKNGYLETVTHLLQRGVSINPQTEYGFTPLHFAIKGEHLEIINILLENGASVTMKTNRGFTPLHFAVITGRVDIVHALLNHKAAHSDKSRHEFTPLHLAAKDGHVEVLNVLLEKGADVEAKTRFKFTPLHLAAQQGHLSTVESLLSRKALVDVKDRNHFTPLHLAALSGHNDVVLTLLRHSAEINAQTVKGNTPIHFAAERRHWQVAETLLKNNADPRIKNEEGQEAYCICHQN